MQPTSKNQFSSLSNQQFPSLDQITRPILTTGEAAFYLNRKPQTLRCWAMKQDGPLHPIHLNGRLAWRVSDIKSLIGGV